MSKEVATRTMNALFNILKTTVTGGILVLLPLLLLFLLLREILDFVVALATPIAELFPLGPLDEINAPEVVSIVLILGASFLFGLATHTDVGRRLGTWLERNTVGKLQPYQALRRITRQLLGVSDSKAFVPAILYSGDDQYEFVYIVESLNDGWVTILLPWAPTPFAGSIKIVRWEVVEPLDAPFGDLTRILSNWGVGSQELHSKRNPVRQ